MPQQHNSTTEDFTALLAHIRTWGKELGFQHIGISSIDLKAAESSFEQWLAAGHHGEMEYMARHGSKRSRPADLEPGTLSIISARMNYLPPAADPWEVLHNDARAYISRYALGRDYHKLIRSRLQKLASKIAEVNGPYAYRVFSDSAPVLEKPIAAQAGLGWQGKHSNILTRHGSWFFLGEIYTNLPLPADEPVSTHCGSCTACIDICPTQAIIAPYTVDARRCISYLTIELHGAIPEQLRPLIGNRIYGCDDCQLICPWNRHAQYSKETDFLPRHGLDNVKLIELFTWSEEEFLQRTAGSPLRRLGHERWLRNIAIALGNAQTNTAIQTALQQHSDNPSTLVREHVMWGLQQQNERTNKQTC
ncbi:MAG: tRNA epoxyqueuosine(34) reductase QueG [Thiohalomonadaceae bacterium]